MTVDVFKKKKKQEVTAKYEKPTKSSRILGF